MVKALLFMFPYHLTQGAHNAMEQAKVVPNMGRIFLVLALQINWGGGHIRSEYVFMNLSDIIYLYLNFYRRKIVLWLTEATWTKFCRNLV